MPERDPAAGRRSQPERIELVIEIDRSRVDDEVVRMRHASEQMGRTLSAIDALQLLRTRLDNVIAVWLDTAGMPSRDGDEAFRPFTFAELRAAAGDVAGGRADDVHDAPSTALELLLDEFATGAEGALDPAQLLDLGIRIGLLAAERRHIPF